VSPSPSTMAVRSHPRGATVALRVVPRAPRTVCVGLHGDAVKLKVAAPPVDGAANDAVRRWVAEVVGRRTNEIEVVAGARGRDKVVLVTDASTEEVGIALAAQLP
jgi:uncharacterized protein